MKEQQKSDSEQPFFQRLADGARSLLGGVAAGLSLLCLASCSTPPGPIISSFGANSEEITDGQTIRITAVLSDSDMGPVQAGIKGLLTDGAARVYGTFSSTMPGIFTYDISWSQLDTEKGIAFASDEKRTYIAEFIDDFGNRITRPFELRLHCGGQPACEGRCTNVGAACPISKNLQCLAGTCGTGCVIDKVGMIDGTPNPTNACQICDSAKSKGSYSRVAPYTECAPGLSCSYSGQCNQPFRQRSVGIPSATRGHRIVAPDANVRIVLAGSSTSISSILSVASKTGTFTNRSDSNAKNLFALDPGHIFLTGGQLRQTTDGGLTYNYLGNSPTATTAVWASGTDIWVSNPVGVVYRSTNSGATFTATSPVRGAGMALREVTFIWGSSPNNVYVMNDRLELWRTTDQGVTWTSVYQDFGSIQAFWGSGPTDLYLARGTGFTHSTDGVNWTRVTPPGNSQYPDASGYSVHGCAANDVFFASGSEIWHFDGTAMKLLPTSGVDRPLAGWYGVHCFAPGKVVAVGDGGGGEFTVLPLVIESL